MEYTETSGLGDPEMGPTSCDKWNVSYLFDSLWLGLVMSTS